MKFVNIRGCIWKKSGLDNERVQTHEGAFCKKVAKISRYCAAKIIDVYQPSCGNEFLFQDYRASTLRSSHHVKLAEKRGQVKLIKPLTLRCRAHRNFRCDD